MFTAVTVSVHEILQTKLYSGVGPGQCFFSARVLSVLPGVATEDKSAITGTADWQSMVKVKGVKLLKHEELLLERGELTDVTHAGASSAWLSSHSSTLEEDSSATRVYRPMGDRECAHLCETGLLPSTQPYQTIVEGDAGRHYAEKYLRGHKSVDTFPTTVVEFIVPTALVNELFAIQCKPEDGVLSHGLGDKGGKTLHLFNESLAKGDSKFRIVLVKRAVKAKSK